MRNLLIFIAFAVLAVGPVQAQRADQTPARGNTMDRVEQRFGQPQEKLPAVGDPPITRWLYAGYTVYFEYDKVLHTVVPKQ